MPLHITLLDNIFFMLNSNLQSKNKKLAKNTLSMYFRMLFLMFISFYTSRIVLQALGIEAFGIYNVVGGVVVMFTFINAAMTTSTQRYFSYELGLPNGNLARIFSACFNIHLWFAFLIVVLSESIGLWLINTKLNFPLERMVAVNWVYQVSVLTCVLNIVRVPYNAAIIAYERMSFYAYVGIVEGLLKLFIVYLLAFSPFDKLIYYALLMMVVIAIITVVYYLYCRRNFRDIRLVKINDKSLYKRLLNFSSWTLFGSIANIARNQGVVFIINIFYGVTVNAAIGIANQVNAGISQFVSGFQQAFNPQLTKAEASADREYQTRLICLTAKYSYLVILFFAIPVLYNLDYLLTFWLGEYPPYTAELCCWIVIASCIEAISGPLWVTIFATGNIRMYQIFISILLLLNLPLGFVCGILKWHPQYIFVFQAVLNFLSIAVRLYYLRRLISFNILSFIRKVMMPLTVVSILLIPILYLSFKYWTIAQSLIGFCVQSSVLMLVEVMIILLVGMSKEEQIYIYNFIRHKII